MVKLNRFFDIIKNNNIVVDFKKIEEAFYFAKNKHEGQLRLSGEPYFNHVFETACILAQNKFEKKSKINSKKVQNQFLK